MRRVWLVLVALALPALVHAMTWQEFWEWIVRYWVMKSGGNWQW